MLSLARRIRSTAVKRIYVDLDRSYEQYERTIERLPVLELRWRAGFKPGVSVISSPFLSILSGWRKGVLGVCAWSWLVSS